MSKNTIQPASCQTDVRRSKKHQLLLTDLELIALVDVLDIFSSLTDNLIDDDLPYRKDLKKVDRMLKKNGYKRNYA